MVRLVERTIDSPAFPVSIYTLLPLIFTDSPQPDGIRKFDEFCKSHMTFAAGNRVYMSQIRMAIELFARCGDAISDDNGSWESFAWAPNFPH
jgi:hypothetical protein